MWLFYVSNSYGFLWMIIKIITGKIRNPSEKRLRRFKPQSGKEYPGLQCWPRSPRHNLVSPKPFLNIPNWDSRTGRNNHPQDDPATGWQKKIGQLSLRHKMPRWASMHSFLPMQSSGGLHSTCIFFRLMSQLPSLRGEGCIDAFQPQN